ncbi:MAG: response regulator [Candidatus Margulisbacteria bacterium]|nr:response regulator [Candidatus Margulisiibacteriota bacterium]
MAKKAILLIEDDARVEQAVKAALSDYAVETVKGAGEAAEAIRKKKPALLIIDYDLKKLDGLQVFRQVHLAVPFTKVIMISLSNDIPLAVTATKMGVADFLKKPVSVKELLAAVERNIVAAEELTASDIAWLQGESPELKKMNEAISAALQSRRNLVLSAERGIDKGDVADHIHRRGLKKKRQFRAIDLADFRRENLEGPFWAAVQEAVGEDKSSKSAENDEDRCGTLYLDNIESLEESFRLSIFEFFKEKKEKVDPEILVVIGLFDPKSLPAGLVKNYSLVEVPPLRSRRVDLPQLISRQLAAFSTLHGKKVRAVSSELTYLLGLYEFPGNYHELASLLEAGVLSATGEILEIKDLPLDFKTLLAMTIGNARLKGKLGLEEARLFLEKLAYKTLLAKSGGDAGVTARFLDIPRTTFLERSAELGSDLLN